MRNILNTSDLRQLRFLKILFLEDSWITIGKVAELLNCSEKTLRNDIIKINKDFYPFHIDVSIKHGVLLTYPSDHSIDFIYSTTLKNSAEFQLLENIYSDEHWTLETYSNKYHFSSATLRRIIKRINTALLPFDIKIDVAPLKFSGDERSLRSFFTYYILERYANNFSVITDVQNEVLSHLIRFVAKQSNMSLNYPDLKLMKAILLANIARTKLGYTKNLPITDKERLGLLQHVIQNYNQRHEFEFAFKLSFDEENAKELFSVFLKQNFSPNWEHLNSVLQNPEHPLYPVVSNISQFFTELSSSLHIELPNREHLIYELFNTYQLAFGSSFVLYDKRQNFIIRMTEDFPFFMQILQEALENLTFDDAFIWTPAFFNEMLYTIIIHWKNLVFELEKLQKPISIGIFCDFDIEHSQFLTDLISFHFHDHVRTSVLDVSSKEVLIQVQKDYDLIITNISNYAFGETSSICIGTIPSAHDWKNIQNQILKISQKNHFYIPKFTN